MDLAHLVTREKSSWSPMSVMIQDLLRTRQRTRMMSYWCRSPRCPVSKVVSSVWSLWCVLGVGADAAVNDAGAQSERRTLTLHSKTAHITVLPTVLLKEACLPLQGRTDQR